MGIGWGRFLAGQDDFSRDATEIGGIIQLRDEFRVYMRVGGLSWLGISFEGTWLRWGDFHASHLIFDRYVSGVGGI
jgi:hypothetical protein